VAYLTVSAALASFRDASLGGKSVRISLDGGATWVQSGVLRFDASNWTNARTVLVEATSDGAVEGERTVVISHSMQSNDSSYDGALIANVEATVVDNDKPGLVIRETGAATTVTEGSASDRYTIALTQAPDVGETVTVTLAFDESVVDGDPDQLRLVSGELITIPPFWFFPGITFFNPDGRFNDATNTVTFNSSNWNVPVNVQVSAFNDGIQENRATERIVHTISSTGGVFAAAADPVEVEVDVRDNDAGGLVVVQSGDSTVVSETTGDNYALQLTRAPTAPVVVSILTDGKTVASKDAATDPAETREIVMVNGVPTVTFDASNWDDPFFVRLDVGTEGETNPDGQPVQTYPPQPHVVAGQIEGPLIIEGSQIPGKDRSLKTAVTLFTETNAPLPVLDIDVDENILTDKLTVYNDGSVSDDAGMLADPDFVDGLAAIYEVDGLDAAALEAFRTQFKNLSGLGMGEAPWTMEGMNGGDLEIDFGTPGNEDIRHFDGGITYRGVETVEVFLGTGDDTFHVSNTAIRADDPTTPGVDESFRTVTMVNTGKGDDVVTVSAAAEGNGILAVNLEEGDDEFNAAGEIAGEAASLELVVFGGAGEDLIRGGLASDGIFGDKGVVDYYNGEGELVTRFGLGLHERSDVAGDPNFVPDRQTDGGFNQARKFATRLPVFDPENEIFEVDGDDTIDGFTGEDVIFGGGGSDTITAEFGGKIILGDYGFANLIPGESNNVETTEDHIGERDVLTAGTNGGGSIMLGGAGADDIFGGTGDNVLIGDGGRVHRDGDFVVTRVETIAPDIGGADIIVGGSGFDVIMGGAKGDTITAPLGGKIILGDNGYANLAGENRDVVSTFPEDEYGGSDLITGGADGVGNIMLGGSAGDTLLGGTGDDVILGDSGRVERRFDAATGRILLVRVHTIAPGVGGEDYIEGSEGFDVIMGGAEGDEIIAPLGGKIILGDNGEAHLEGWHLPDRDVFSTDAGIGGADYIVGGADGVGNIILGGAEGDDIFGGTGDDTILGDSGYVQRAADGSLVRVYTMAPGTGGEDYIEGGEGFDVIMGGAEGDQIYAPLGGKIILGDNGQANLAGPDRDVFSTDPAIGGSDVIVGGADGVGNIILGGAQDDDIAAGTGDDVVLGDSGYVQRDALGRLIRVYSIAPDIGGADRIEAGVGYDVIMGGAEGDTINAPLGKKIILGDSGEAHMEQWGPDRDVFSIDPTIGGNDTIVGGADGQGNIILGGAKDDDISSGIGEDVVLGDSGYVQRDTDEVVLRVYSIAPDDGGKDEIYAGDGYDIVMGGADDDFVDAGFDPSADIVLGDSGSATFLGHGAFDDGEEHAVLSFNFVGADHRDDVTGVAGAAVDPHTGQRVGNWNNVYGGGYAVYGDDAGEILYFDDGAIAPGIGIQWGADLDSTAWHDPDKLHLEDHSEIHPGFDQDKQLFDGYLTSNYDDTVGVNLTGLGSHFRSYDVYVYLDMEDSDSRWGTSVRSISGNGLKYYLNDPDGNTFEGTYVEVSSTSADAAQKGNYVVFRNVTSDTFDIRIDDVDPKSKYNKPGVAGLQVVGTRHAIDRIETISPASGGDDVLLTGGGDDIVFGGYGNDMVHTAGNAVYGSIDNDIVAGDDARATFMLGELRNVSTWNAEGLDAPIPGNDRILTGNGDDVVIGGNGEDVIDSTVTAGDYDYGDVKVVSIKFNSEAGKGSVTGTAGAVAVGGWNNLESDGKGWEEALAADDGSATGVKVQWGEEGYKKHGWGWNATYEYGLFNSADLDSHDLLDPDTQNERLFESYIERDDRTLGVDLTGLGELGTYDVYVYFDSDEGDNRHDDPAVVKISAGGVDQYVNDPKGNTFGGTFVDASSTDRYAPATGNYVVFRGLTLDELQIRLKGDESLGHKADGRPSIAGIQIVSGADRDKAIDLAADRIGGDFDNDLVLGDNATINWYGGMIYEAVATGPQQTAPWSSFQADTITTGEGADVVVGGNGNDHIMGGEGGDLLLGDNARLLWDNSLILELGEADDWNDGQHKHHGHWYHHHDHHGHWHHHHGHFNPYDVMGIELLNTFVGGNDTIEGGAGDDLMYGQFGADTYVFAGGGLGEDAVVEAGYEPYDDHNHGHWFDDHHHHHHWHHFDWHGPNDVGDTLDFSQFAGKVDVDLGEVHEQTIDGGQTAGEVNLTLTLFHNDAIENVIGSDYDDDVEGNDRDNVLLGRGGNDKIDGDTGYDLIGGGDGDDELKGGGHDHHDHDHGYGYGWGYKDDHHDHDHHHGHHWFHHVHDADVILGGAGNDKIWGEADNDWISGGDGDDQLWGNGGNDAIFGNAGNDKIYGNADGDWIDGGDGDDWLYGNGGADIIFGGAGNDRLYGSSSGDWMHGGDGDDWLYGDGGNDVLLGGEGNDTLDGGDGDDILSGGAGDDVLKGDDGDDVLMGNAGSDKLYGEDGDDLLDGGDGDDLLEGGDEDDILLGGAGDDTLKGGDDDDLLAGEDGEDKLYGEDDDDILLGGAGNDYLDGGRDDDKLEGGLGTDTLKSERRDDLVEQEQKSGQLGLKYYFKSFEDQFGQCDFYYVDPTGGDANLDDRPPRLWIQAWQSGLPGSGEMLLAAAPAQPGTAAARASESELTGAVEHAVEAWTAALGAQDPRLAALEGLTVTFADLDGPMLAQVNGNTVLIDIDAAGHGWFVDATPGEHSEFTVTGEASVLAAHPGSAAFAQMDLVTVVMHEIGHVLGLGHDDADRFAVMDEDLEPGVRRLLDAVDFDADPDQPISDAMLRDLAARAAKLEAGSTVGFDLGAGPGAAGGIDWNAGAAGWSAGNGSYAKGSGNFSEFLVRLFKR
jgi:Ca2+-binding RTX toxin-like protein